MIGMILLDQCIPVCGRILWKRLRAASIAGLVNDFLKCVNVHEQQERNRQAYLRKPGCRHRALHYCRAVFGQLLFVHREDSVPLGS